MSRTAACITLVVSLSGAPALAAQSSVPPSIPPSALPSAQVPPPAATPAPSASSQTAVAAKPDEPQALPVNLARIKTVLDRNPTTKIDSPKLRFYIDIVAKQPSFKDFLGSYDLINGPVKNTAMTNQEFLDMVTPKMLHSSAGFTATDTLQVALTNWAAMSAIKKAFTALRNARNESEVVAIRAQITRELAALRGGGQ